MTKEGDVKEMRASLARINKIKPQLKREEQMSYRLKFSSRKLDGIFGTAYPRLKRIPYYRREHIISRYLETKASDRTRIKVDYRDKQNFSMFLEIRLNRYYIEIGREGYHGYQTAIAVEKTCLGLKRLGFFSPPRWWNRFAFYRYPTDIFMINQLDYGKVIEWLQENCRPRDYQIFTKFDEDVSLGFRDPEHATMFKLTFGEEALDK